MSCNACAKAFTLLRKEKGCPACGFSYCSKCLNDKIFVPKLNTEAKVCFKCKKIASTPNNEKNIVVPPDAYYRRMGASEDKQTLNESSSGTNSTPSKDQEIAERLRKLKEAKAETQVTSTDEDIRNRLQNIKGAIPSTSDAEIQERLAKLRGVPIETVTSKPFVLQPDNRTEQEQANDLLKQYMEQASIDTKYKNEFDGLITDMETRMNNLRGTKASGSEGPNSGMSPEVESENEEETVKKIVEKMKAEALMDDDGMPQSTNDELPFCEICNEDARMRCLGCKYLFCKRCFQEHKDDDDGCDRYEPYTAPKSH